MLPPGGLRACPLVATSRLLLELPPAAVGVAAAPTPASHSAAAGLAAGWRGLAWTLREDSPMWPTLSDGRDDGAHRIHQSLAGIR